MIDLLRPVGNKSPKFSAQIVIWFIRFELLEIQGVAWDSFWTRIISRFHQTSTRFFFFSFLPRFVFMVFLSRFLPGYLSLIYTNHSRFFLGLYPAFFCVYLLRSSKDFFLDIFRDSFRDLWYDGFGDFSRDYVRNFSLVSVKDSIWIFAESPPHPTWIFLTFAEQQLIFSIDFSGNYLTNFFQLFFLMGFFLRTWIPSKIQSGFLSRILLEIHLGISFGIPSMIASYRHSLLNLFRGSS